MRFRHFCPDIRGWSLVERHSSEQQDEIEIDGIISSYGYTCIIIQAHTVERIHACNTGIPNPLRIPDVVLLASPACRLACHRLNPNK